MAKEYLMVYDEDDKPIGDFSRDEVHEKGLWHHVVHLWLTGVEDGKEYLYFQQRALDKKDYPGFYEIASSGHIDLNETPGEAICREAREEISVYYKPEALQFLGTVEEPTHFGIFHDNERCFVFLKRKVDSVLVPGPEVKRILRADIQEYYDFICGDLDYLRLKNGRGEWENISKDLFCRHGQEFPLLVWPALQIT